MKFHRAVLIVLAAHLVWAFSAFAQGPYKVESIGAADSPDLPKALRDALHPAGVRLADAQGVTVCDLWLRQSIAAAQDAGGSGERLYAALSTGILVGVLRLPNGGADFRGQPLKPGFYTLRYALIPQDGNHMGVSQYRDFLLLGPAGQDTAVDQQLTFDDTVKLSRLASGTGHPAILSLGPAHEGGTLPALTQDDQGHWLLTVKVAGKLGDIPIGIILVGKAEA